MKYVLKNVQPYQIAWFNLFLGGELKEPRRAPRRAKRITLNITPMSHAVGFRGFSPSSDALYVSLLAEIQKVEPKISASKQAPKRRLLDAGKKDR